MNCERTARSLMRTHQDPSAGDRRQWTAVKAKSRKGTDMGRLIALLLMTAAVAQGQVQQMGDALTGLQGATARAKTGMGMGMGMGACDDQDMPYMGMYTDGVSPWWQANFAQMHGMMCSPTSGMYMGMHVDGWKVPAHPGDVFDIAFAGPYNTLLAIADDDPNAAPYAQMYATTPGTGSQAGSYVGGWMGFTVPASFTHGYMAMWVGNTMSQMPYMMGAVKRSSGTAGSCTPSATALCLDGGRFQVSADWTKPTGENGHGNAITLTSDTGYFWFFDQSNVEMVVKVLDGCVVNGHQWVFAGGLTNVAVTLTVTNTQTGTPKVYENAQGAAFVPIQDTGAFACP